jgi:hypothetical protein
MGEFYKQRRILGLSVLAPSECWALASTIGESWYWPMEWSQPRDGLIVPYKWSAAGTVPTRADARTECLPVANQGLGAIAWPLALVGDPDPKQRAILVGGSSASASSTTVWPGTPNQHTSQGWGQPGAGGGPAARIALLVDPAYLWQHCRADNPEALAWAVWLAAPGFWPQWAELEAARLGA